MERARDVRATAGAQIRARVRVYGPALRAQTGTGRASVRALSGAGGRACGRAHALFQGEYRGRIRILLFLIDLNY